MSLASKCHAPLAGPIFDPKNKKAGFGCPNPAVLWKNSLSNGHDRRRRHHRRHRRIHGDRRHRHRRTDALREDERR